MAQTMTFTCDKRIDVTYLLGIAAKFAGIRAEVRAHGQDIVMMDPDGDDDLVFAPHDGLRILEIGDAHAGDLASVDGKPMRVGPIDHYVVTLVRD